MLNLNYSSSKRKFAKYFFSIFPLNVLKFDEVSNEAVLRGSSYSESLAFGVMRLRRSMVIPGIVNRDVYPTSGTAVEFIV